MAKRIQGTCLREESKLIKCGNEHRSIDRISMLPNELLWSILSHLTFKEITCASILSRRWRYLPTFARKLEFDGTMSLLKVEFSERRREVALDEERWNYVNWVNSVIALHKGPVVEELRVFFNLDKTYEMSIDTWLKHALARKVERLDLNLTDDARHRSRRYDECYNFPYKLLYNSSTDIKYLRKLSMNYVNVNGEALGFVLKNCPLLEDLSVSQSGELTALRIIGPFLSLKCLEISLCHNLKSLEIRDVNLVRLKYRGPSIYFSLMNVPLLVDIFIGGVITTDMKCVVLPLQSYFPKLEIFTIAFLMLAFSWGATGMFYPSAKMSNLKQLVMEVCLGYDESLLPVTNLTRSSPCLQRFVLKVNRFQPNFDERKAEKIVSSYTHLKEIEFVGYRGVMSDLDLVMHFIENSTSLEKIIIDPRQRCVSDYRYVWKYNGGFRDHFITEEMDARTRAKKQLTHKVPRKINLVIL